MNFPLFLHDMSFVVIKITVIGNEMWDITKINIYVCNYVYGQLCMIVVIFCLLVYYLK